MIKSIRLGELTSFQMVNFHKQRAITTESIMLKLEEDIMVLNNVTKFHEILIKFLDLESGHRFKW